MLEKYIIIGRKWIEQHFLNDTLQHHGIKDQKWGVRNGPPYPLKDNSRYNGIRMTTIPEEKFTEYSLNPNKAPDKVKAFKEALGYTLNNYKDLIKNIENHFDAKNLEERGDAGYGMRYQQIMKLEGPNGKEANVLTAWIKDGENIRLTSVYVTKKEATK